MTSGRVDVSLIKDRKRIESMRRSARTMRWERNMLADVTRLLIEIISDQNCTFSSSTSIKKERKREP